MLHRAGYPAHIWRQKTACCCAGDRNDMTTPGFLRATTVLLAAAMLAMAGCTSNAAGSAASANRVPATSASTKAGAGPSASGSYQDQLMAWGRRFAACARSNGSPNFPDPVYPDNAQPSGALWGFALFATVDKTALGRAANGACADVARQMPSAPDSNPPPSAATLASMRQYAQCMRHHGMSDFPDPKADGTFPILNTRYAGLSDQSPEHPSNAVADADHACREDQDDWAMQAS